MSIRLLQKSEIDKARQADAAKEIAEGLKLSRRVDSLRELQAKEEQALEKFRTESLSAIQQEINSLIAERDGVRAEIEDVKLELSKETTLTRQERFNLENLKLELQTKEKEIDEKSKALDLKEIDIAGALKDSQDALARARTREEEAEILYGKTKEKDNEVSVTLQRAFQIEKNAQNLKNEIENSLAIREQVIADKETVLRAKEEQNAKVAAELEIKYRQLSDQRTILETELKRLRDKRLNA